jgi:hypothetical protein
MVGSAAPASPPAAPQRRSELDITGLMGGVEKAARLDRDALGVDDGHVRGSDGLRR